MNKYLSVPVPDHDLSAKAVDLAVPYWRNKNSSQRTLLVFDSYHSSDAPRKKFLSGMILEFIKVIDAEVRKQSGQSIFQQDLFTIYLNYFIGQHSLPTDIEAEDSEEDKRGKGKNSGSAKSEDQSLIDSANHQRVLDFYLKIRPTKVITLGRQSFELFSTLYEDDFLKKATWTNMLGVPAPIRHDGHRSSLVPVLNPNQVCIYKESRDTYLIGYFIRIWKNAVLNKLVQDIELRPEQIKVQVVDTVKKFNKMLTFLRGAEAVAIDTETDNLNRICNRIVVIQFSLSKKNAFVLPLYHFETPFTKTELDYIRDELYAYFAEKINDVHIYCNANFDLPVIRTALGLPFYPTPVWDVQAGEFVLDENLHELKSVTHDPHGYHALGNLSIQYGFTGYLSGSFGKEDRSGIANLSLDTPGLIAYCAYDVAVIMGIYHKQLEIARLKKHKKYENVVKYLFGDTIHVFSTMNVNGVLTDKRHLWYLSSADSPIEKVVKEMEGEILNTPYVKEAEKRIRQALNMPEQGLFGAVNSGMFSLRKKLHKQILFFDVVGLPPKNWGKDGKGKLDKVFQEENKHVPIVEAFTNLSKSQKLKQAFVQPLTKFMSHNDDAKYDGRIRPSFNFLRVVTGRTSACLTGDSLIALVADPVRQQGVEYRPIKAVKAGDMVWAFNDRLSLTAQTVAWSGLTKISQTISVEYQLPNGTLGKINCTPDHRFRLPSGEYLAAELLHIGQPLLAMGGIAKVLLIKDGLREAVYDLTIPDHHNFIAQGVCVHNSNPNLQQIPSRGKMAKYIKRLFIASPGTIFIKVDYCIAGDSLIQTEKGLIRIDSMATGEERVPVKIEIAVNSLGGRSNQARLWVYSGIKETLEIQTKSGNITKCTPEHKLAVYRDGKIRWVEAQHCKEGDYLCLPKNKLVRTVPLELNLSQSFTKELSTEADKTNVYRSGKTSWYCKIKYEGSYTFLKGFNSFSEAKQARDEFYVLNNIPMLNRSFRDVERPNVMTPDLAFLLGALIAEGSVNQRLKYNYIRFDNSDVAFLEKVVECFSKVFGITPKMERRQRPLIMPKPNGVAAYSRRQMYCIRVRNNSIAKWLCELGMVSTESADPSKPVCHSHVVPWSILQADEESQLAFLAAYLEGDGTLKGNQSIVWSSVSNRLIHGIMAILNSHGYITKYSERPNHYTRKDGGKTTLYELGLGNGSSQDLARRMDKYIVTKRLPYAESVDRIGRLPGGLTHRHYHFSPIIRIKTGNKTKVYDLTMTDQKRRGFIANGHVSCNCAHEIRGWALISGDKDLSKAFQVGIDLTNAYKKNPTKENLDRLKREGDIHRINSAYFFGLTLEQITDDIRQAVKGVTFGLIYGRSAKSLAVQLGKSAEEVNIIIDKFFQRFRKAANWLLNVEKHARAHYYVEAVTGLRRHLWPYLLPQIPDKKDSWKRVAAACDRRARNSVIQGAGSGIGYSAARLMEAWTAKRFPEYLEKHRKLPIRNQNMVHDSMEFEVDLDYILYALEMIEYSLTKGVEKKCTNLFDVKFPVGLSIDMEIGGSLDSMQKWDNSVGELRRILTETFQWQRENLKYDIGADKVDEILDTDNYWPTYLKNQIDNGYLD